MPRTRKPSPSMRLMIFPKLPLRTESGLTMVNVRFDMILLRSFESGRALYSEWGDDEAALVPIGRIPRDGVVVAADNRAAQLDGVVDLDALAEDARLDHGAARDLTVRADDAVPHVALDRASLADR